MAEPFTNYVKAFFLGVVGSDPIYVLKNVIGFCVENGFI